MSITLQKALDQMNLQLHHVISDITGQTGLAIVGAILEGKRDPLELAKLRNQRIKASEAVIAKSLVGDYRPEHLFTLQQSLDAYRNYQKLVADCDREIRRLLEEFQPPHQPGGPTADSSATAQKAAATEGVLCTELKRIFGVDLTRIPESAPVSRKLCLEKSGPISRSFAAPLHSPRGWGYAQTTILVPVKSFGWVRERSTADRPRRCGWRLNLCTTVKAPSATSTDE